MKISAKKLSAAVSLAVMSAGVSFNSQAAGFALIENSASGMGNAFAGAAAVAEDASTIWFNPAGMTKLEGSQIVIAGHIVSPTADFTNNGSTMNPLSAITGSTVLSGTNDDGGETAFVPNFYYSTALSSDVVFGVGVNAPFGLETNYDPDWVGRYTATKSELMTININPSLGIKATDKLSLGFGLNIQYIDATLANEIDTALACVGLDSSALGSNPDDPAAAYTTVCNAAPFNFVIGDRAIDSSQELSGDDWSIGWNLGFLYDIDDSSRLGVAYRSSIKHKLEGSVDFTRSNELQTFLTGAGASNLIFVDTGVTAVVELPQSLSVSYFKEIDSAWTAMADVTWTKWRNFSELTIVFDNPYQRPSTIPEDWEDSYRFSFGMSYQQSDKLTYRFGVALDQTPIKSPVERTPRIPGNDRTWLSLGIGYHLSTDMTVDVGYSHLFVDDTDMDNTDASFSHTVTGTYEASVDILSAQLTMKF